MPSVLPQWVIGEEGREPGLVLSPPGTWSHRSYFLTWRVYTKNRDAHFHVGLRAMKVDKRSFSCHLCEVSWEPHTVTESRCQPGSGV